MRYNFKAKVVRSTNGRSNASEYIGEWVTVKEHQKGDMHASIETSRGRSTAAYLSELQYENGSGCTINSSTRYLEKPTEKPVGKKLTYEPGTPIMNFVKNLLKSEPDKTRAKWLRTFENCILPQDVRDAVDEAITTVLQADKFDEWGINEHFEKGLTNSILLFGPPGTGKTMITESIAAVLGKNMMKLSSGDIQSNIPGQTERNIKDSFEKAAKNDAVLLLDECDSILADRSTVGAILAAEINALLTEIERFEGVVVMTTNRRHTLDPALQRRIISSVELSEPTLEARKQIWKKLIPKKMPIAKDVDTDKLAIVGLTGGEIKNAILVAAKKAIAKNASGVSMKNFLAAVESIHKAKAEYASTRPQRVRSSTVGSTTDTVGVAKEKKITRTKQKTDKTPAGKK